jgi:hypothetical protein
MVSAGGRARARERVGTDAKDYQTNEHAHDERAA